MSTSSTCCPATAREAARLMAVVVLATPPFWLATAMILACLVIQQKSLPRSVAVGVQSTGSRVTGQSFHVERNELILTVFHVEQVHAGLRLVSRGLPARSVNSRLGTPTRQRRASEANRASLGSP